MLYGAKAKAAILKLLRKATKYGAAGAPIYTVAVSTSPAFIDSILGYSVQEPELGALTLLNKTAASIALYAGADTPEYKEVKKLIKALKRFIATGAL